MKKTSGIKYVGVYESNRCPGKFIARIRVDSQTINLGTFKNQILAAIAYDKEAIKYGRRTNLLTTKLQRQNGN